MEEIEKDIDEHGKKLGLVVQKVNKNKLNYISQTKNHPVIITLCSAKNYCFMEDIL